MSRKLFIFPLIFPSLLTVYEIEITGSYSYIEFFMVPNLSFLFVEIVGGYILQPMWLKFDLFGSGDQILSLFIYVYILHTMLTSD